MFEKYFTHHDIPATARKRRNRRPTSSRIMKLTFEALEDRRLLTSVTPSASSQRAMPASHVMTTMNSQGQIVPKFSASPVGLSPIQLRHAYGFDQISFSGGVPGDGRGMTVAIVDAYDDPKIASDLDAFSTAYGLPTNGTNGFTFKKVSQTGSTTALPVADFGWAGEIALDVEWVHAIAPRANILLVEATDNSFANLLAAVDYARSQPGVVAVSMSWGGREDSTETTLDSHFLTPAGHTGVAFFVSSGDAGSPAEYPSSSPNVVSVGGTTMLVDSTGNILSETGWVGGGGGVSAYESKPAYQNGIVTQSATRRATPDVALDSDPWTGVSVYDSYNEGTATPWTQYGGTSAAAPQWAALKAIADQGRVAAGLAQLSGIELLTALYQLPASNFHDIAAGGSAGSPMIAASSGYDLATGLGSPVANAIVASLTSTTSTEPATHLAFTSAPTSTTAGGTFSITVSALDASNKRTTAYQGTVRFTTNDLGAGMILPADYTFTAADNGQHTFTGLKLVTAGARSITAKDTADASIVGTASVTVTPAAATHFGLTAPTDIGSTVPFSVGVTALDAFGNTAAGYRGAVHFTTTDVGNGIVLPADYTFTAADNGAHTFTGLKLATSGPRSVVVTDKANGTVSGSASITVGPVVATHFGVTAPASSTAGNTFSVTITALDGNNNPVSDYTGSVHFTSTDTALAAVLPSDYTFTLTDAGVHAFSGLKLVTAGTKTVTATDTANANLAATASLTVAPAAATHLGVTAPSGTPSAQAFNVTVTALDLFENKATAYRGAIHFTSTDVGAGIVLPADYTFTAADNGAHQFIGLKLITAGSRSVVATDKATATINGSAAILVGPAAATHFSVNAPANSTAGDSFSVTITALDASNNTATGYAGKVHFTTIDAALAAVIPSDYTFTVADVGTHTFTGLMLATAGSQTVTATDAAASTMKVSATITVVAGAADSLVFGQQPTTFSITGTMPGVTVRIVDAYKNVLAGDNSDQITLSLGSNPSGATLGGTLTKTVVNGVGTFSNLSLDKLGVGYTVVATFGAMTVTSNPFDVITVPLLTNALIEGFDGADLNAYTTVGSSRTASLSTAAKHDGTNGLQDANGTDWIYRNDAAVQVKQGDTISTWLRFSTTADGRAYFGFGASATGALSVIAAANTKQLILDVNNAYGFSDIATAPFTFAANKWYKLEVNWGTSGAIVGKLYDTDGTTVLQQVSGTNTTITSGGIAFRGTTSTKQWDSVTLTQAVNNLLTTATSKGFVAASNTLAANPRAGTSLSASTSGSQFYGPVMLAPTASTSYAVASFAANASPSPATVRSVTLGGTGVSRSLWPSTVSFDRSTVFARPLTLADWLLEESTLESVAQARIAAV